MVFALGHAAALLVAPFPPSAATAAVHRLLYPYLSALFIDTDWNFFAPTPGGGQLVRYTVVDAAGAAHAFTLTEALARSDPAYFRLGALHRAIGREEGAVVASVGRRLCRRHADLSPVAIRFAVAWQVLVTPEEWRAGRRPLDADALLTQDLPPVACPA